MKHASKIVFSVYVVLLLWLILFKTVFDIISVLMSVHIREVHLIPFTSSVIGMIENFIIFIPLGLFLGMYFKEVAFRQKLFFIFAFSLALETIQYIFAIGVSDINDVMTNTLGGFVGLAIYHYGEKHGDVKKMDRTIVLSVAIASVIVLLLRFFVFRIKY